MRKAIQLQVHLVVTLEVEGEDEPAHDFAQSTSQAVHDILQAGAASHPELQVTVQNVIEASNDDGDENDDNDGSRVKPTLPKVRAARHRNPARR